MREDQYDYIINKPELNEDTLSHYGIKGMKWRKHLKGKYYSLKSKAGEAITKRNRKKNGMQVEDISENNGKRSRIPGSETRHLVDFYKKYDNNPEISNISAGSYNKSTRNTHNIWGRIPNRDVERGIEAGRERAKKRKK